MSKKEQFNILIKPTTYERIEKFLSNNLGVFKKRGAKSQAGEMLLEMGLDIAEKQAPKPAKKHE